VKLSSETVYRTEFPGLVLFKRGKVRDIYTVNGSLLIVATDRVSCFDVVLPDSIPDKGKVLTELSHFWFKFLQNIAENHLITPDAEKFPASCLPYRDALKGRAMLVKKTVPLPVECVVRGYLSGSGWKEYQKTGSVCGIRIQGGLNESSKLSEPIFTPATKEETGHDINISRDRAEQIIGRKRLNEIEAISIELYGKASDYADSRGIIIADTKFEFGVSDGKVILIDEILTPDSSRFWPKDQYERGRSQPSFDKQFVRDYLESTGWDKVPPAPHLPAEIIAKTRDKYLEAYRRLTGREFV
jgi:phosphoribosylaminoimidazole-succinocarboxamide synthase